MTGKRLVLSLNSGALCCSPDGGVTPTVKLLSPPGQASEYCTARSVRMTTECGTVAMDHNRTVDEKLLNQRAREGWELTAVTNSLYYFHPY